MAVDFNLYDKKHFELVNYLISRVAENLYKPNSNNMSFALMNIKEFHSFSSRLALKGAEHGTYYFIEDFARGKVFKYLG